MNQRTALHGLRRALLVLLLAILAAPAAGRDAASANPNAVIGVLPNGLHYYVERVPAATSMRMTLLVDAGFFEGAPEHDAAHVVEHLVVHDAMRQVSAWGGAANRDVNATTAFHWTSYYLDLPANNSAALNAAFSIMLQWTSPQAFTDDAIDREIKTTIEELRSISPSVARLYDLRRKAWFDGHPLLSYRENANGTSSATPRAIRAFHARWYRPPHLAIVITGDVDPRAVEREIRLRFTSLASGGGKNKRTPIKFRLSGTNHYVPVISSEETGTTIELTYKRPLPKSYEVRVEEAVVARFAARLFEPVAARLKDKYSPAVLGGGFLPDHDGSSRHAGIVFATGMFELRSNAAEKGALEILSLIEAVRRSGFSSDSVERVRADLLTEAPDPDTPSQAAERWRAVYIEGDAGLDRKDLSAKIRTIPARRVNQLLSAWFAPTNRDIIFKGPAKSDAVPDSMKMDQILAEAAARRDIAVGDLPLRKPVLPDLARGAAGTADPRQVDGLLMWTLPKSGATLLYRRTKGLEGLRIEALRPGGVRGRPPTKRLIALAAGDIVPASGLGGSDKFEFARSLTESGIALDPFIADTREGFRASGPKHAIGQTLRLARASLFEPDCRAEALDDYWLRQNEQRQGVASGDTMSALSAVIAARLGATPTIDEAALEDLALDDVCGAYRSTFADMRGFTIVVEADLEPGDLVASVAANLDVAAISEDTHRPAQEEIIESARGQDVVVAGDGSLATVLLVVQRRSSGNSEIDASAGIANRLLKDRLTARLRGFEKGTYAVNVQTIAPTRPDYTYVALQFDCDAAHVEHMVAAAQDELRKLREDGVPAEELATAKTMIASGTAPTLHDLAERWIAKANLAPAPIPSNDDVNQWMKRNLDAAFVHIFVRLPAP